MKAVVIAAFGGPEALGLREFDVPQPRAGEVRVRIAVAGVNFSDTLARAGASRRPIPLPFIPGTEAAGTVEACAPDVEDMPPGTRVAYEGVRGSYVEHALVPREKLVVLPAAVTFEQAAAVLSQGLIAQVLAHDLVRFTKGMTAVVHAAAGGVGLLLVQMLKARGVFVIGTASSDDKRDIAVSYGADVAVGYEDFVEEAYHATGGKGADVVFDSIGKPTQQSSFDAVRTRGAVVVYGRSGGVPDPIAATSLMGRSITLVGVNSADFTEPREEYERRANALFEAVANATLHVRIDRTLRLTDAAEAHRLLESRETSGKILLSP